MSKLPRHFLDLNEVPTKELRTMLDAGIAMKAKLKAQKKLDAKPARPLEGKTLAMIFEKPSTRTRVSFDVGMRQLGGERIRGPPRRLARRQQKCAGVRGARGGAFPLHPACRPPAATRAEQVDEGLDQG